MRLLLSGNPITATTCPLKPEFIYNANKPSPLTVPGQVKNSGNKPSPRVAQNQRSDSERTFADWCREKTFLSPESKYTVEILLKKAGTTECGVANQTLSSLAKLDLNDNKISDIKPLKSLTNLTEYDLGNNKVRDIKPLQSLTNLTELDLGNNQIRDIKPLECLTKLKRLDLGNNLIRDIKSLESLTNLGSLELDNNLIRYIKPLKSLSNLGLLYLENNLIRDIKPLESLTTLGEFYLSGNLITPKTCPLKPDSICLWEEEDRERVNNRLRGKIIFPTKELLGHDIEIF
jgi:internalin A